MDTVTKNELVGDRQDCLVLPYVATTEDKANMFADAIDALFYFGVETEVFVDGGKWGVAVVKGMGKIGDPVHNERVVSAFILVTSFDLADRTGTLDVIASSVADIPPAQEALTQRTRRQFRIEDKLDAILSRLDQNAATGAQTALATAEAQPNLSGKNGRRSA